MRGSGARVESPLRPQSPTPTGPGTGIGAPEESLPAEAVPSKAGIFPTGPHRLKLSVTGPNSLFGSKLGGRLFFSQQGPYSLG